MIMMKHYCSAAVLLLIFGLVIATEHYMDYGEDNAAHDIENLREFYRLLLRRNAFDNNVVSQTSMDSPYEHLMIRKSQRSPSLRLRFGRSGPAIPPASLLARSETGGGTFGDN